MCGKQYASFDMMPLKVDISETMQYSQSPGTKAGMDMSIAMAQYNRFLIDQMDRRLELLAIFGLPPGLTSESQHLNLPEAKIGANDCWDQSTACSISSRPSSPGSSSRYASDTVCLEKTDEENNTTVMIRNIVGHCSRKMLLDFMDRHGFKGKYNLLYLPQRFGGKGCFHYAFVNFLTAVTASEFQARMQGFNEVAVFGDNVAETSWSQCQGLEANVEKFRNSSVMHPSVEDECRPLFFKNGKVVSFPKPTRTLKLDRRKRDSDGA
jgi:hypothetical protein